MLQVLRVLGPKQVGSLWRVHERRMDVRWLASRGRDLVNVRGSGKDLDTRKEPSLKNLRRKAEHPAGVRWVKGMEDKVFIVERQHSEEINEEILLFERARGWSPSLFKFVAGTSMVAPLAGFLYLQTLELIDYISPGEWALFLVGSTVVAFLSARIVGSGQERNVLRMSIKPGGFLEMVTPSVTPFAPDIVRTIELDKCSVYRDRFMRVAQTVGVRNAPRKNTFSSIHVDEGDAGYQQYSLEMSYATHLDEDLVLKYIGNRVIKNSKVGHPDDTDDVHG